MSLTTDSEPAKIAEYLKIRLPQHTHLAYITPNSIGPDIAQANFRGPFGACDALRDAIDDQRYEASIEMILRIVSRDELQILQSEPAAFENIMQLLSDRDQTNIRQDLIRNMPETLMRYRLCENWKDFPVASGSWRYNTAQTERAAKHLADIFHVSYASCREAMIQLIENATYGGSPEIIWYGRPKDILDHLMASADNDQWLVTETITFHNPVALVIDSVNGSGHDVRLKNTSITVPLDASRIVLDDAPNNGYSWNSICDLVKPYYQTELSFSKTR